MELGINRIRELKSDKPTTKSHIFELKGICDIGFALTWRENKHQKIRNFKISKSYRVKGHGRKFYTLFEEKWKREGV